MLISVFEVIAAIANIATAIGLVFAVCTYHKDSKRKTKQDTLEAYERLQQSVLSELNLWTPSQVRKVIENKQSDDYKALSGYLAEIERFCTGINQGIYDFTTFYELSHGYFDSERGLKSKIIPVLEAKLSTAKEDYYTNIHKVWANMEHMTGKH